MRILNVKYLIKYILISGLFLLPLVFWPKAYIPYEIPKVWFFQRWVEVLAVLGLVKLTIRKPEKTAGRENLSLVYLVILFLLSALASSIAGVDIIKSVFGNYYRTDGLLTLLHLAAFFLLITLFWEKSWENLVAFAISGGSLAVSVWVILLGVLGRFGILGGSMFGKTVGVSFGNPNFLAGYLLVSLPFTVFALRERGRMRVIGVVGEIAAIFLTGSRAAILGIFLLGLGYLWGRLGKLRIIGILVIFGILGMTRLKSELKVSEGMYFYPESRGRIVVRGYKAFLEKPVLGWGTANFDYAFESINWPMKYERDVYVDKAHSNLLEVLVCGGLVGFGIYVGIVIGVLGRLGKKKTDFEKALLLSFLLFLFHSQMNVISINEEIFFWLIAGITASLVRFEKNEKKC